jgi:hypothetical protein
MFKKRTNNNKTVDLNKETEHILAAPQENQPEESAPISQEGLSNLGRTPLSRQRAKGNSITLEAMELNEVK